MSQGFLVTCKPLPAHQVPDPVALFPLNNAYGTKEIKDRAAPGIPSGVHLSTGPHGQAGGCYEFSGTSNSYIELPNTAGGPLDVQYSLTLLRWVVLRWSRRPYFQLQNHWSLWGACMRSTRKTLRPL